MTVESVASPRKFPIRLSTATTHAPAFSPRELRPRLCCRPPSSNSESAGNSGCWLHPRSAREEIARMRGSTNRFSRSSPAFPAQWFYDLLRALLGEPACLPPSPARYISIVANLAPAWARQDHTTSPSANAAARLSAHSRPPHPRPTCRDDRDTPL